MNRQTLITLALMLSMLMVSVVSLPAQRETRNRMDDLLCFTRRDYTRVIVQFLESASDVVYKIEPHPDNPSLFYIDFYSLRPHFRDQELPVNDGMLRMVQVRNYPDQNAIRLIFHLQNPANFGEYIVRIQDNSLIVDMMKSEATRGQTGVMLTDAMSMPRMTIAIDPGHGGNDSGAMSPYRVGGRVLEEKDIVLSIARRVQRLLVATGRYDARLTRSDDRGMSLDDRVDLAQRMGADLFISIHANHAGNPNRYREARGLELYYISYSGAQRQVNAEVNRRGATADVVQAVVGMANEQVNQSYLLCEALRACFQSQPYWAPESQGGQGFTRGIFRRNFAVLRNFDMPCVLIETGFVTHPEEGQLLTNSDFQETIARNIANGVITYQREMVRERQQRSR